MEEQDQLLKDFVATAQKYGYDYDVVMPKFPEFEGYDVEMLKGYVSKVEELNQGSSVYDYTEANAAFPELFAQKKKTRPKSHLHRSKLRRRVLWGLRRPWGFRVEIRILFPQEQE